MVRRKRRRKKMFSSFRVNKFFFRKLKGKYGRFNTKHYSGKVKSWSDGVTTFKIKHKKSGKRAQWYMKDDNLDWKRN